MDQQNTQQRHGYWREDNDAPVAVSYAEALAAWSRAAYPILVGVAGHYHAVITYGELGRAVQEASGVHTRALLQNWIGRVLGPVVHAAHHRGDPPLTALVVHTDDGMVGEGYKEVLQVAGLPPAADEHGRELHAANSRLACYRAFCTSMPADGGKPALAPRYQDTITRRHAAAAAQKQAPICPTCRVQLPATGLCDNCC
jgi:CubicO group peptidase (beta-lactamase class C family)